MPIRRLVSAACVVAAVLLAPTAAAAVPRLEGVPGHWKLALNSHFNGSALPAPWRAGWFSDGVTVPVNKAENDCYSPKNVTFPGDGSMHLAVSAVSSTCGGATRPDTGALVSTNPDDGRSTPGFQYRYGVLQARVYLPRAVNGGIADWPAVWSDGQSWPADGEDDVLEGLRGEACWHFHDPLGGPGGCSARLKPGWHIFASDWQPGSVTYYYDGARVGRISTGITSSPMYLILDDTVAAGEAATVSAMRVSYVRVWQS